MLTCSVHATCASKVQLFFNACGKNFTASTFLAEHYWQWGHGDFLTRGLERVKGEFSLSALAYNLRRVLNLKPMSELLSALPKAA